MLRWKIKNCNNDPKIIEFFKSFSSKTAYISPNNPFGQQTHSFLLNVVNVLIMKSLENLTKVAKKTVKNRYISEFVILVEI